jgi:hypothetical protein
MFDLQSLIKYLLEGLAVAVAAYLIPRKTVDYREIALIALTASAIFAVLDQFAPAVAVGARQGAGFGIGYHQVGMGYEGFQDLPILGYDANGAPITNPNEASNIAPHVGGFQEGFQDVPILGYDANCVPVTDPALASTIIHTTSSGMCNGTAMATGGGFGEGFQDAEVAIGLDAAGQPTSNPALVVTPLTPVDPTQVGMGYEGYDDYEGFETSTPGGSGETSGVCQMKGDSCSYDPKVTTSQKSQYVCHKDGGNCGPISACRETPSGDCDWADNAQSASDLGGRKCKMETVEGKKQCRLNKPSGSEGFDGGDISGFEGFSKVF